VLVYCSRHKGPFVPILSGWRGIRNLPEEFRQTGIMIPKRKIRCYITLACVAPNIYNYPVYALFHEGWSNFSLVTCSSCGELFVIDWENPKTKGLTIRAIAASNNCPSCNSPLRDTLQDYPQTIKLPNGQSGSFTPDKSIPPNSEILVVEFFELAP